MSMDDSVDAGRAVSPPTDASRTASPRKLERGVRGARRRYVFGASTLLLVAVLGPLVVATTAAPAYADGPTITGAGSSYASVAIDQWIAEISSIDGDNINYSDSNSVTGLNEFAQGQVNFGASEIGYSTGQANYEPPPGYKYQYLPDVAGATCMMYNLDNPITGQQLSGLDLTTAMILGIFTGTITTWGQLATGGLNAQLSGDHNPIITVFRTDPSGENYILSSYLDTIDPAAWAKFTSTLDFPPGPQALWPFPQSGQSHPGYDFSNWDGQNGSDDASQYVYSTPGSITYVETAYALAHNDPCAAVQNLPGDAFVQPSALADAEALLNAKLEPDLEQLLSGVFLDTNPKAYTISAYSYLITPEEQMNRADGAVLGQFVEFLACQGQQSAITLGYSPLPPNLVDDDFAGIKRIAGAAAPPASVNAQTCNDPYVGLFGGSGPPPTSSTGGTSPSGTSPGTSGTSPGGSSGTTSPTSSSGTSTGPGSHSGGSTGPSGTSGTKSGGRSGNSGSKGVATTTPGSITTQGTGVSSSNPAAADPSVGLALFGAAGSLDGQPRPIAPYVLISMGFLLLVAVPPAFAWVRLRKRRQVKEI
jgi:ABC-type phosphate transport system substrate-binding protein